MIKKLIILFITSLISFKSSIVADPENVHPFVDCVNVITGEYNESQEDLILEGARPLNLQRNFYCEKKSGKLVKQGWHFNIPGVIKPASKEAFESEWNDTKCYASYDEQNRLTYLSTNSKNNSLNFNWLKLSYNDGANKSCRIETSDNRSLEYFYRESEKELLIDKIVYPNGNEIHYLYTSHPTEQRQLIKRKELPNQHTIEIEYLEGKVNSLKAPVGTTLVPLIISQFIYKNGETEVYNALNNKKIYKYAKNDRITSIETFETQKDNSYIPYMQEKLFWSNDNRLVSHAIEDNIGKVLSCKTFKYDKKGNLIEESLHGNLTGSCTASIILNSDGTPKDNGIEKASKYYEYITGSDNSLQLLIKTINENGLVTANQYDKESDLLTATFTYKGNRILIREFFHYDKNGLLIKTITDDGNKKDENDLNGVSERKTTSYQLKKKTPNVGAPINIEEKYLDLKTKQEKLLKLTVNTYDDRGLITQEDVYDANGIFTNSTSKNYNRSGQCSSMKKSTGEEYYYEYDSNGNIVYQKNILHNGSTIEIKNTYDYAGRLIKTEEIHNNGKPVHTSFRYNLLNLKIASIDHQGNETLYEYDSLGRHIATLFPEIENEKKEILKPIIKNAYDILGNIIQSKDSKEYATTYSYTSNGKPTLIKYADDTTESFKYNLDGSLKEQVARNGTKTLFYRDTLSRIVKTTLLSKEESLIHSKECSFNAFRKIYEITVDGNQIFYTYDDAGRLTCIEKQSPEECQRTEYTYDALCQIESKKEWYGKQPHEYTLYITERDAYNKITAIRVEDATGTLLRKILPESPENDSKEIFLKTPTKNKSIYYDAAGNKTEARYSSLNDYILSWSHGPNNRLESFTEAIGSPQQRTTSYKYNEYGQLETLIKPDGTSLNYEYNELSLLSHLSSSDHTIDYTYSYDIHGNITRVFDGINGTLSERSYNTHQQVIEETLSNTLSIKKTYDLIGRPLSLTLPDNSSISYVYNAAYLIKIKRNNCYGETLYSHIYNKHDLQGRSTSEQMILSTGELSFSYDSKGRLSSINSPHTTETLSYTNEKLSSLSEEDSKGPHTSNFTYDENGQLINENSEHFTYDALGNRLSKNNTSYTYSPANELVQEGNKQYTYDANGNLTKKVSPSETVTFTYDALNRLTSASNTESWLITFHYDAFNRRTSKTTVSLYQGKIVSSTTELFLYDGNNEIGTVNEKREITSLRILGTEKKSDIGATVAIEIDNNTFAPIHDHKGSIKHLVDTKTGEITESYLFTAFGEETITPQNTSINPWRFLSKRKDEKTHLIFFGQRYYDAESGRWTSPDPIGFPDGPNRYIFALNDPINNTDLYGHFSISETWNGFVSTIEGCSNQLLSIGTDIIRAIAQYTAYFNHIRPSMTLTFEKYFGKGFLQLMGYYQHPMESGVYGHGEFNDKIRITLLNGIANVRSYFKDNIERIYNTHGKYNIHYIFRPTSGWSWDMLQALLIKFGYVSPYAKELARTWKALINDMGGTESGGLIIHYCHSLGGADTATAALLITPEERRMIRVISLGTAKIISDDLGFESVTNYISVRDGVCLLDPINYIKAAFNKNSNVVFIGTFLGCPLVDHSLGTQTYSDMIANLGTLFTSYLVQ